MGTFTFNQGAQDYKGEVLNHILTYAIQENETFKENLIHVKSGIQKRYALPLLQSGRIIQDHKPTPDTSVGEFNWTQRTLEPNDFMIYIEFNPRDYEEYYREFQPHNNLLFRELDPTVQAAMLQQVLKKKEAYLDHAIWCSAKAATKAKIAATNAQELTLAIGADDEAGPMKYFDGAIARLLMNYAADADSEDAKGGKYIPVGTGTFSNGEEVETQLYKMWRACPAKIRKNPNLEFLMDYSTWDKYDQYLSNKSFKYTDNRDENQRRFRGKRVLPLVSLPENTIILGQFSSDVDSNLWMGVDYASDQNVLQVEKLQANSELWFMKMILKMDVNIVKPGEIVAHLPYTYDGVPIIVPGGNDDEDDVEFTDVKAAEIFSAVVDPTGQNPYSKGWYTESDGTYTKCADTETTPQQDTTYYEAANPKTEGWYERSGEEGSYEFTETTDETYNPAKTYWKVVE